MSTRLHLGIDFGTSGCRACVIDDSGAVLAEVAEPLPEPLRDGDAVEQDPNIWWDALKRLLVALPDRSQLKALAIDGTSGTVLLADKDGTPITPALMYNDGRAPGEPRGLWLLRQHPEAARLHSQADWLSFRLTGRHVCDSNNALKLPPLPEVVPAGTPIGTILPAMAEELGLPAELLIVAGTTDSTAALIASGASAPGDAVTSLGSTLVLKVISDTPISAPEYGVYSQPYGERWLVGGASNSGGAVLRQFFSDEHMAELTTGLNFDVPTGLDYTPLPSPGERFPINDPKLQPCMEPRPDDELRFFQGLLEGIARIEARGYHLLHELGAPYPRRLFSVGGGARNRPRSRLRLGLIGCDGAEPRYHEAAYGAALLARRGLNDKESTT